MLEKLKVHWLMRMLLGADAVRCGCCYVWMQLGVDAVRCGLS